jgi:hypothetical protein
MINTKAKTMMYPMRWDYVPGWFGKTKGIQ